MRLKYLIALFGLFGLQNPASAQTPRQNYTMHRVMLDETGTVGVTEVQYYDGLGRPTVAVSNANGNGTNFTYQLQEYDAKGRASNHKITAVLLTILSTVLGLIPFFIDGQDEPFWFSFAVGSSGGLLFSILAIIFVMPALMRKIE